jgi:uncharacterized protein
MLKVDLAQLQRKRRVPLEAEVEAGALGIEEDEVRFVGPVHVRLEAQQVGTDVLVRGMIEAQTELACRRCLRAVRQSIAEEVTFHFREDAEESDAEDVYPLPARENELDLTAALREQLMLAVPAYVVCDEACKGFCPRCGANLNEGECACAVQEVDERWAALRRLKSE